MTGEDRFRRVYRSGADDYDRLVSCEDCDGHLLPALRAAADLGGDLVEFGAGTGRLTRLLVPSARSVRAFDVSPAMVAVARGRLGAHPAARFAVAANHALPVPTASADLALAGWTFGHAVGWNPAGWREEIGGFLAEMERILRPSGTALVLETLGTGSEEPAPPPALAAYFRMLEDHGFTATWIRTDYRFPGPEEADRLCRAFFGAAFPLQEEDGCWRLPECTGIWAKRDSGRRS